jgi:hypothetical protein
MGSAPPSIDLVRSPGARQTSTPSPLFCRPYTFVDTLPCVSYVGRCGPHQRRLSRKSLRASCSGTTTETTLAAREALRGCRIPSAISTLFRTWELRFPGRTPPVCARNVSVFFPCPRGVTLAVPRLMFHLSDAMQTTLHFGATGNTSTFGGTRPTLPSASPAFWWTLRLRKLVAKSCGVLTFLGGTRSFCLELEGATPQPTPVEQPSWGGAWCRWGWVYWVLLL